MQPFPYLNALDDDGNFIDEADTVVQSLMGRRLDKMAKIVERYKKKVEESYNTCGVLQIKNLQKIKKA